MSAAIPLPGSRFLESTRVEIEDQQLLNGRTPGEFVDEGAPG
jgi:hypothetical protein